MAVPEQKPPMKIVAFTVADWASNEVDVQSTQCISSSEEHSLETSTCTQQVTVLSIGELEFNGVVRWPACALEVRQLLLENIEMGVEISTDSCAARGMVRRSGSGRVKLQERTTATHLHVGTVDTALNSADLGTKFHHRRRFDELLMMLPLRIGVGRVTCLGAEGTARNVTVVSIVMPH